MLRASGADARAASLHPRVFDDVESRRRKRIVEGSRSELSIVWNTDGDALGSAEIGRVGTGDDDVVVSTAI